MKRLATLTYGFVCYAIFFAVLIYSIAFIGSFLVCRTIELLPKGSLATAIATNLVLFGLSGLLHRLMARHAINGWWTSRVPRSIERGTRMLCSTATWCLLMFLWQPIPGSVWTLEVLAWRIVMVILFALGWIAMLISVRPLNDIGVFGLRQVGIYARKAEQERFEIVTAPLYKLARRPQCVGWGTLI